MKKLAWVTDIHLDYLDKSGIDLFFDDILRVEPDLLLVAGDIGEADSVFAYLERLAARLAKPVYFVLGNHDYYNASIEQVRAMALDAVSRVENLHWLENAGVVGLSPSTALIGHGAWGDGRLGDYAGSEVRINDWVKIQDFHGLDAKQRLAKLNRLGDEAAAYLYEFATEALQRFEELVVLTHVPPFREACLYQGKIGGSEWLPFFTCAAVGRVLKALMQRHPDQRMKVLCGHSHHAASLNVLPNLAVEVGAAEYGAPAVQALLRIE